MSTMAKSEKSIEINKIVLKPMCFQKEIRKGFAPDGVLDPVISIVTENSAEPTCLPGPSKATKRAPMISIST